MLQNTTSALGHATAPGRSCRTIRTPRAVLEVDVPGRGWASLTSLLAWLARLLQAAASSSQRYVAPECTGCVGLGLLCLLSDDGRVTPRIFDCGGPQGRIGSGHGQEDLKDDCGWQDEPLAFPDASASEPRVPSRQAAGERAWPLTDERSAGSVVMVRREAESGAHAAGELERSSVCEPAPLHEPRSAGKRCSQAPVLRSRTRAPSSAAESGQRSCRGGVARFSSTGATWGNVPLTRRLSFSSTSMPAASSAGKRKRVRWIQPQDPCLQSASMRS
jgi:hypothetical protein